MIITKLNCYNVIYFTSTYIEIQAKVKVTLCTVFNAKDGK